MDPTTPVESIRIDSIVIGERRRARLGSLASLKRSIETHGIIHPIVVRNGNALVAGARRLEACRQLGWEKIPARRVERMSDDDLRSIELDENEQRLALADYESSRQRLAEIRQAEAEARAEAESVPARDTSSGKRKSRKKPGSKRDIEKRTGVSKAGQQRLESHVAIAERFPFMQKEPWKQYTVLEAGEKMEAIPKAEHKAVAVLIDQPGVPPKSAIKTLGNLGAMDAGQRAEIYGLAKSADPEDNSAALTMAARLPREPHRCVLALTGIRRELEKCKKHAALVEKLDRLIAEARKED
jgi:ParB-like chromosome segregation protein Spo0J